MSRVRLGALALCAMGVSVGALLAPPAEAVNTRTFVIDAANDLAAGQLDRVAVTSDGTVVLGADTERVTAPDPVGSVWSLLDMGDGSFLAGTGVDGRVYRIQGRAVSLYAETGAVVVTSLTRADDGAVYAGTLPDAKLFRLNPPQGDRPAAPTLVATLPGAQHIWAVTWDRARRAVLCATGPEGKLFAVDPALAQNNATVVFDSEEPHLYAMALGRDGEVLLGSGGGHAIVYGVRGPGRVRVIARLTGDEVKGIAAAGDEVVAISNEFTEAPEPPRRTTAQSRLPAPGGPTTPRPRPGRGSAWRIRATGFAERVASSDATHYAAMAWDGARRELLLGSGVNGRVVAVADDRTQRLLFDVDETSVTSMALGANGIRLFGTGDQGSFYRVLDARPTGATWHSRVLDATTPARWGAVRWRGAGALDWEARSGNSDTPDATWSAWEPLDADGAVRAPGARYLQVRARFDRDPGTVIRSVTVYYLPENQRAVLLDVSATAPETKVGEARRSAVKLGWKVDNPDADELRFRLRFRADNEATWRAVLRNQEWLTASSYEWPVEGLPEGWYRVEVEASDESANADDVVTRDRRVSEPVLVDGTAPTVTVRVENGRVLGEARDGASAVVRIEMSVDGGEWRPLRAADGISDERAEELSVALPPGVAPGEHSVSVRAFDEAGNSGVGSARFRR